MKSDIKALAIGKFDGLHKAHMGLINELGEGGGIVVIDKNDSVLTPKGYREKLINIPFFYYNLGAIKELEGHSFIALLQKDFKNLQKIIVGYDFMFGKDRSFCAWDIGEMFEGECIVVPEIKSDGISVHSGVIKELLKHGDILKANMLLEREYEIWGEHITGQGLGKKALYPTINLHTGSFLLPAEGVYATKNIVEGKVYDSVSFIGHRVSTDRNFSVESYILAPFDGVVQGEVGIKFVKRIRENRRYTDLTLLKAQISEDIENAKTILGGQV